MDLLVAKGKREAMKDTYEIWQYIKNARGDVIGSWRDPRLVKLERTEPRTFLERLLLLLRSMDLVRANVDAFEEERIDDKEGFPMMVRIECHSKSGGSDFNAVVIRTGGG